MKSVGMIAVIVLGMASSCANANPRMYLFGRALAARLAGIIGTVGAGSYTVSQLYYQRMRQPTLPLQEVSVNKAPVKNNFPLRQQKRPVPLFIPMSEQTTRTPLKKSLSFGQQEVIPLPPFVTMGEQSPR
jgi:hypothetical protein